MHPDPIARIRDLSFTYRKGTRPALERLSLTVHSGEMVAVLGHSGAGKSTLCQSLNGLIPQMIQGDYSGEVVVLGRRTTEHPVREFAAFVGLVFQDFEAQLFSTTVEMEVAFGPENLGLPREEIGRRVAAALRAVRLEGLEQREPATLSGGQKQRLAIAAVLAMQPRLLCMDEPTTDLDPVGREEVFAVVRRLRDDTGMGLLLVENETEEVLAADRVVLLREGRMEAQGSVRDVLGCVDRLKTCGVAPPQVAELFQGEEGVPLTVEEALAATRARGWRPDPVQVGALEAGDRRREEAYGEPLIQIQRLVHEYATGTVALQEVDLSIRQGEFVALVGQNGSGKTTLVKHLNGLLRPTSGTVVVKGMDARTAGLKGLSRVVGYVFQNPDHQIFAETVHEEVAFGPRLQGLPPEAVEERVAQALAAVGMQDKAHEDPFSLAKGERQRVAVASVLATRPEVMVLDEPTTGLDWRELESMMALIRSLNAGGCTIIMVTHAMGVAAAYAHRLVVMKEGRILADGPVREVFGRTDVLQEASLKPPPIVAFSRALGFTALSVEEARRCLKPANRTL